MSIRDRISDERDLVGIAKILIDRQRTYVGYLILMFMIENFVSRHGWYWWYLAVIPIWAVFAVLEYLHIFPREQSAAFRKHPQFREIYERSKSEDHSRNASAE